MVFAILQEQAGRRHWVRTEVSEGGLHSCQRQSTCNMATAIAPSATQRSFASATPARSRQPSASANTRRSPPRIVSYQW
jgi:hypothetical protein